MYRPTLASWVTEVAPPGAGKTTAGDPSGMSWHGGYVYHFKGL